MPGLVRPAATSRSGDQRWIGSRHALSSAQTGTLSVADFTPATHYPDGFIPSGLPVNAADPANIVPWTGDAPAVAGDPTPVLRFIKDSHQVVVNTAGDVPTDIQVALIWHGLIKTDYLPGGAFAAPAEPGSFVFEAGA